MASALLDPEKIRESFPNPTIPKIHGMVCNLCVGCPWRSDGMHAWVNGADAVYAGTEKVFYI